MLAKGTEPSAPTLNRTEAEYRDRLVMLQRAGEVAWFRAHCVKLRLADNTFYEPDFLVMCADGMLEVHEVKGGFVRDDAAVKIKVAAAAFPFRFMLARRVGRAGWLVRSVSDSASKAMRKTGG